MRAVPADASGVEIIATYDTAGSAKLVADERLEDAAAIASARAAEVFGLVALASGIQDFDDNITRFLVIGRRPLGQRRADKTTIVFTLPNEPGSLFKALSVFALRDIDLTKLESRPIPGRAVGVPVLRGSGRGARRPAVRAGAGAPGRVRADAARRSARTRAGRRREQPAAADPFEARA